jgi:hypothetical protein
MRRIERAAKQADAHARRMRWQDDATGWPIGRTGVGTVVQLRLDGAHRRELTIHGL